MQSLRTLVSHKELRRLVVDEAHCISVSISIGFANPYAGLKNGMLL